MGDCPTPFDGVKKSRRSCFPPGGKSAFLGQAIETGVDFNSGELGYIKLKVAFGWATLRIKRVCPAFVHPAAGSDIDLSGSQSQLPESLLTMKLLGRRIVF